MNRRRLFLSLPILAGALVFAACSTGPGPSRSSFQGSAQGDSIRIFVTNLNFMDATIWAVSTGTRERLGVVTGKRNAEFAIPWEGFMDLHLEIDILSGPRCVTESLPVDPGDDLELIINVEFVNSPNCRWEPYP